MSNYEFRTAVMTGEYWKRYTTQQLRDIIDKSNTLERTDLKDIIYTLLRKVEKLEESISKF